MIATKAAPSHAATGAGSGKSAARVQAKSEYWRKRQTMMYYQYVLMIAGKLSQDASSLIDVGSRSTSITEEFHWIPERAALDIEAPYSSENVRGIKADFFAYQPEKKYDIALCLQVLEHIPDAQAFARKLLDIADRVLVSVPYDWPEFACRFHCQDPVNARKLAGWFGREPDYRIVVQEPFQKKRSGRRLIAYFHTPGEKFRMQAARTRPLPKPPAQNR